MARLSIIIPCYFNEANIPITTKELVDNEVHFPEGVEFEYVFVDDGSKDQTFQALKDFKGSNPDKHIKLVKLAKNVGSYNAILAGMQVASGDCNLILSADLQDPVDLIPKMFGYWSKGIKLVIANRKDREDPFFQKVFAQSFQYLIRKLALSNMPKGGYDLVLFDKELKEQLLKIDERNSNSLYLLLWLTDDFVTVPYTREKRQVGKSRWTLKKKIKLLIDSFVAFSFFPIRLISVLGFVLAIAAIIYAVVIIYNKLVGNIQVEGWTALALIFLLVSSFQMFAIGILGEYLWRTLDNSRNRPNYVIDEQID